MYGQFGGLNQLNGGITPAVRLLLIANVAAFLVQGFLNNILPVDRGADILFGLSRAGVASFYLWQLVTYMFLHGSVGHLLLNMLVLFFLGPETERAVGTRQFCAVYFLSGSLAGLGWILVTPYSICVGASGAIFGILGAFATLFPHRQITVLLFFVLPLTMKAWVLVAGLVGIELLYLVGQSGGGVAHSVHFAGALVGYLYTSVVFRTGRAPWELRLPRRGPRLRVMRGGGAAPPGATPITRKEVDRILDKIARDGVNSLSAREKEVLEAASRHMGR
jgi:membrane associated rhomboid family serine protease